MRGTAADARRRGAPRCRSAGRRGSRRRRPCRARASARRWASAGRSPAGKWRSDPVMRRCTTSVRPLSKPPEEVLAAPLDGRDPLTHERIRHEAGRDGPRQPGVDDLGARDRRALDERRDPAADGLDLGQLGHRRIVRTTARLSGRGRPAPPRAWKRRPHGAHACRRRLRARARLDRRRACGSHRPPGQEGRRAPCRPAGRSRSRHRDGHPSCSTSSLRVTT